MNPRLLTTLGPKRADELGLILPHEHVFVDLRTCDQPGYAQGDAADVIRLMGPGIAKAQAAGVTALVECTPVGVGRRAPGATEPVLVGRTERPKSPGL